MLHVAGAQEWDRLLILDDISKCLSSPEMPAVLPRGTVGRGREMSGNPSRDGICHVPYEFGLPFKQVHLDGV